MNRPISAVLIICLIAKLQPLYGYKWIPSKAGDPIPDNAVYILESSYVGRARHVNIVLPAAVTNEGATIYYFSHTIKKLDYEILVADEQCTWVKANKLNETIVRAGSAWNGEPIFVGKPSNLYFADHYIQPVLLTSFSFWEQFELLMCEDNIKWIDAPPGTIPSNAVGGGVSDDYKETFVARLIGPSVFVPGQITSNSSGIATATYNRQKISSIYCQVLVGDTNEYSWKFARNGEIPSYAVAAGLSKGSGLIYVSRLDRKTLGSITFQEAVNKKHGYEILVKNVE